MAIKSKSLPKNGTNGGNCRQKKQGRDKMVGGSIGDSVMGCVRGVMRDAEESLSALAGRHLAP